MALYESVIIGRQDLTNSQFETLIDEFTSVIKSHDGEIKKTEYWGIRNLAYKINKNRKAHYYCAIVFITSYDDPQPIIAEGVWQGEILSSPKGVNGFGYDPIFMDFKTDQSAAELSFELKNKISHRGQALQKLKHKLKILYGK